MDAIAPSSNHLIDWTHHFRGLDGRVEDVSGAVFRHAVFLTIAAASAYVYANTNPYLFMPLSTLGLGYLANKAVEMFDSSTCLISAVVSGAVVTGVAAYSIFNATSLMWLGALAGSLSLDGLSSIFFALGYSIPLLHSLLPYRSLLGTEYPSIVRKLDDASAQFSLLRFLPGSQSHFAGIAVCCINSPHSFHRLLQACDVLKKYPGFIPCNLLSVFLTDLSLEQVVEFTILYHRDPGSLTQSFLNKLAERFGDLSVLNTQIQTLRQSLDPQESKSLVSVDTQLDKLRRFLSLLPPAFPVSPTLQPALTALSSQLDRIRGEISDEIVSNYDALGAIGFSITDFRQLGQMLPLLESDLAETPIQVVSGYLTEHELPDREALVRHGILKNGANDASLVRKRIVHFCQGFSTINLVVIATVTAARLVFQMLRAPRLTLAACAIGFWRSGRTVRDPSLFQQGTAYSLRAIHGGLFAST